MRPVLVAVLLAPVVFASVLSVGPAEGAQSSPRSGHQAAGSVAAYPAPEPTDHTRFGITANYSEFAEATEPLDKLLPNVDVSTVMASAGNDRRALCHTDELDTLSGPLLGMCFTQTDTDDCKTYPQGLTTTRDATNGDYDGHQLVATAWYHKQACGDAPTIRNKLVLADWDADHPDKYQKLMMVYPYIDEQGKPNFRPHTMHLGGMSWYGDYLYVTAGSGLRIFDMRKIWEVSIGPVSAGNRTGPTSRTTTGMCCRRSVRCATPAPS